MTQPTGSGILAISIDERLTARVPSYVLGLVAVPAIDVVAAAAHVTDLLTAAEDEVHRAHLSKAEVAELPPIAAWRAAYREVDVNPNRFPCAAESVLRRVAKGDRLPRINALVDLCNAVSLVTQLPVASCDVGDIADMLTVRPADGTEQYQPLGAPDLVERPGPGEIIYADAAGRAHSRRWNWRQSDVVRTDLGVRRLLLTVEAVHSGGRAGVERAVEQLSAALDGLAAPGRHSVVLDRSQRSAVLDYRRYTGVRPPARPGARKGADR